MTDGSGSWGTPPGGQPARPGRMSLVTGSVVAIVLFATVGAVGGWGLAKSEQGDVPNTAQATPTTGPSATGSAKSQQPVKPTNKQTTPPAGQVLMPDLVGRNFKNARQQLRAKGLKITFQFEGVGQSESVSSTIPLAGDPVRPGSTVQVFVIGEAPRVVVPNVVGLSCQQAVTKLVDAGLEPEYAKTNTGMVAKQRPEAAAEKRWNDQVQIHCGGDDEEADDDTPETPTP